MLRCHQNLIRRISLATVLACAVLGAACGQKGPLYRPEDKAQQVTPATGSAASKSQTDKKKSAPFVPAPQSQKEDRATESSKPADTATDTTVTTPPVDSAPPATVPPSQPPGAKYQAPGKE